MYHLSIRRLLILALLIAAFALFGGYIPPEAYSVRFVQRSWAWSLGLFHAAAFAAVAADIHTHHPHRVSHRPLIIFVSILAMLASLLWIAHLKTIPLPM